MSFLTLFKRLDVYRDVPKHMAEQTVTGATLSIVCMVFSAYLLVTEMHSFMTVRTVSDMYVDAPRDTETEHAMIQINMNITMHRLPCAVLSVDAQDIMGSHVVDVGGKLHKRRLSAEGRAVVDERGRPRAPEGGNPEEQKGEGCMVFGNMVVKKVPGNFHISCHAHANLIHVFFAEEMMNVSHSIHHLSFGDEGKEVRVDRTPASNPLNSVKRIVKKRTENDYGDSPVSFEYYIEIVPTTFHYLDGEIEHGYQFVANSNEIRGNRLPAVYFRYDMSPITMRFREEKQSFAHFLVQICAIIGGVFTVLGILSAVLNSSLEHVLRKAEINKLG